MTKQPMMASGGTDTGHVAPSSASDAQQSVGDGAPEARASAPGSRPGGPRPQLQLPASSMGVIKVEGETVGYGINGLKVGSRGALWIHNNAGTVWAFGAGGPDGAFGQPFSIDVKNKHLWLPTDFTPSQPYYYSNARAWAPQQGETSRYGSGEAAISLVSGAKGTSNSRWWLKDSDLPLGISEFKAPPPPEHVHWRTVLEELIPMYGGLGNPNQPLINLAQIESIELMTRDSQGPQQALHGIRFTHSGGEILLGGMDANYATEKLATNGEGEIVTIHVGTATKQDFMHDGVGVVGVTFALPDGPSISTGSGLAGSSYALNGGEAVNTLVARSGKRVDALGGC